MKRLAIVHYLPLEYYPPITNFLDLMVNVKEWEISVYTTGNRKGRNIYKNNGECKIFRVRLPEPGENFLYRVYSYLNFSLNCLISLIRYRPNAILYYESISVGPVYFYMKLMGKCVPLFIHYHEYCSPDWYKNGMSLVKWYHILEKKSLYKKALWISQTNKDRIRLFLKDNPEVDRHKLRELPNYPPASWHQQKSGMKEIKSNVTKTIYIGALSLETTYIKEFCEWLCETGNEIRFDIFSYNTTKEARTYLKEIKSEYIRFFENGVEYNEVPTLLSNYDVGVVLYKPLIDNFKYNAPNKLFEYLVCGLEVWFPESLLGILPYQKTHPLKVFAMNFNNLNGENIERNTLTQDYKKDAGPSYTAENGLASLFHELAKL